MPIMMLEKDGRSGPVVICDVCKQRIMDATDGNYEWLEGPTSLNVVFFTHKNCSNVFEREHGKQGEAGLICNMELQYFPVYLGDNLKLDWGKAKEYAGRMGEI